MNDAAAAAAPCVIQANPDIAGIGVRISIYVQACTALIPAILSGIETILSSSPHSNSHPHPRQPLLSAYTHTTIPWPPIYRLTTPNLGLGYCLFLTSLIQALTSGLSVYHALILLNLHVIIAFSLSPYLLSSLKDLRRADFPVVVDSGRDGGGGGGGVGEDKIQWSWTFFLAHVFHVSCTGAFGIWVFATLHTFDRTSTSTPNSTSTSPSCTPSTVYTLLIKNITVSHAAFRRFFLVFCSFLALPIVNTIILHYIYILIFIVSLFALSPSLVVFFLLKRTKSKLGNANMSTMLIVQLAFVALAALTPQILMIIATERMILVNNVGGGEGRWTFGQSVALGVAIVPVRDVVLQVRAMSGRIRERTRMRMRGRMRWKGKAPVRPRHHHPSIPSIPSSPNSPPQPYAPPPPPPPPVPSPPTLYEPATYPGELPLPTTSSSSSTSPIVEIPMINITQYDV